MAAVWFFFAIGVLDIALTFIVAGIWCYGIVASYIVTAKEYVLKCIELRREKISKLKLEKIEVEDNSVGMQEETEVVEAEEETEEKEAEEEVKGEEVSAEEVESLAKDILNK